MIKHEYQKTLYNIKGSDIDMIHKYCIEPAAEISECMKTRTCLF